jgi:hypothetical protein
MCKRSIAGSCGLLWATCLFSFQPPDQSFGQQQPMMGQQGGQLGQMPGAQIPGAPQQMQQMQSQVPERWEEVQSIPQGIDEGRGDWYVKRQILRKARQVDEQVRKRVQDIDEIQKQLMEKYGPQEKRFATAIAELPTKMADITAALTKIEDDIQHGGVPRTAGALEATVASDGPKTDVDRQRLVDLNDSKKLLSAFKDDFGYLTQLQEGTTKALQLITQEVEQAHSYEQQSVKFYEQIDATLSDRIAEQLLLQMQANAATVEAIIRYFSQDLPQFFETSSQMFDKQRIKVEESFKMLVERKLLERPLTEAQKAVNEAIQKGIADAQKAKAAQAGSWWGILLSWLVWPFVALWGWVSSLWS